ncbi:MAG: hypothetical protein AAFV80_16685, partial [Bacteroidota bacterium]
MKSNDQDFSPSRRQFFVNAALAGIATSTFPFWLSGCKQAGGKTQIIDGQAPFNVWAEMIEVLKTSPDNYPARKEALIAAGDLEAMLRFVRDELILIPARRDGLRGAGGELKYGMEHALRCGMATPREKAEILKDMFNTAGIEATVKLEEAAFSEAEIIDLFLRDYDREFAPQVSKAQINRWSDLIEFGFAAHEV